MHRGFFYFSLHKVYHYQCQGLIVRQASHINDPVCYTKDCPRQNIIICMLHLMTSVSCPDRPAHTRKDGLVLGPTIWEGPIRLQEFAYHANVTFKITCDSYLNPAPWARDNAQFEITRSLHAHKLCHSALLISE